MKLKQFFILSVAFVIGWVLASVARGQITGPSQTQAGTLAIFESTAKADWSVSPTSKTAGAFFADSSGTRIFFASPVAGEYEVIAATVENGEPKLYTLAFVNGQGGPTPQPEPDPQPEPEPEPITLADWIKTNVPPTATPDELLSISYQFKSTATRIKQGTIRTVDQAFAMIRVNVGRYENWSPFFGALGERDELKTEDVNELGKVFEEIAEQVSGGRTQDSGPSQTPEDCETGNCPVPRQGSGTRYQGSGRSRRF